MTVYLILLWLMLRNMGVSGCKVVFLNTERVNSSSRLCCSSTFCRWGRFRNAYTGRIFMFSKLLKKVFLKPTLYPSNLMVCSNIFIRSGRINIFGISTTSSCKDITDIMELTPETPTCL